MKRPNFLFIMVDQLRVDHTGFGGNTVVKTPNLDKLAAQSRQFNRAYSPIPICGPCRRTLLTGQMPSTHGCWYNHIPLPMEANTFTKVLREAGYKTGLVGKANFQDAYPLKAPKTPDPNKQLESPLVLPPIIDTGTAGAARPSDVGSDWSTLEMMDRHDKGWVEMPDDFYGFGHAELVCNHDDRPRGHYQHWVREQGGDLTKLGGPRNALQRNEDWQQIYQSNVPPELYTTSYIAERSLAFIEQQQQDEAEPFFLMASFPDPHHPFALPEPYYSMYDSAEIPLPPTFHNDHSDSLPHFQKLKERQGEDYVGPFLFSCNEDQYRAAVKADYGAMTMLDEAVGRMLSSLEEKGLAENTVIVFCTDHGDMFGDHAMMLKMTAHFDGVVRVPLLIKAPGVAAGETASLASLIDLPQTILGLAQCQPFMGMQGYDLAAVLEDSAASVRDSVLIEEDQPFDFMGIGRNTSLRTVITETARLTLYDGYERGELFALDSDPHEQHNLFGKPEAAALQAEMTTSLARTLVAHANPLRFNS